MLLRRRPKLRRGAYAVEFALVAPIAFLLLLTCIVGAMGVFRYQELAYLCREGARYASTHGAQYSREKNSNVALTSTAIYNAAIAPKAVGFDPNYLTYTIVYDTSNEPYRSAVVGTDVKQISNTVTVTMNYTWVSGWTYFGDVSLTASSKAQMSY
jgi:Flp pilus assembly protein TadG